MPILWRTPFNGLDPFTTSSLSIKTAQLCWRMRKNSVPSNTFVHDRLHCCDVQFQKIAINIRELCWRGTFIFRTPNTHGHVDKYTIKQCLRWPHKTFTFHSSFMENDLAGGATYSFSRMSLPTRWIQNRGRITVSECCPPLFLCPLLVSGTAYLRTRRNIVSPVWSL